MKNNAKLKVLHVAPLPPPQGGMATYLQELLHSDVSKSVDFQVIRMDHLRKDKYDGFFRVFLNYLNAIILTVIFIIRTLIWQPDIVHIQTSSGFGFYEKVWIAFWGKAMGKKTLLHVHGGNFSEFYKSSSIFMQKIIYFGAQLNDRVLVASPQMLENMHLIGLRDSKITLIGNAVNLPKLIKVTKKNDSVTILFLTRIVIEKGIIELMDSVRSLHDNYQNLHLRIVGAEELETGQIKDHLSCLNASDYIHYIGPVSELQKFHEYLTADIFAFPTHIEDQSYAVLEAMSYGLPCVASNVGGIPSLILPEENGLLVPPKDVDSLKGALKRLIRDQDLRQKLGISARNTIEQKFSWKRRSKEMIDLYQNVSVSHD